MPALIPYRLVGWLGLTIALVSVALMGVSTLAPKLMAEMGMRGEAIGWYSGTVWFTALLLTPFAGSISQRRDPWRVSQSCLVMCALGIAFISLGSPWLFWLGAILIGAGQAFEAPPASQLLSRYSPAGKRALAFSFKQAGVQLGALSASLILPILAIQWSLEAALWTVCTVLLIFAICLRLGIKQYPQEPTFLDTPAETPLAEFKRGLVGWWPVLKSQPDLLRLSVCASAFGATQVSMNSFMVTWLVNEHNITLTEAGFFAACMQATGLFARPLWGWVASGSFTCTKVLSVLGFCMSFCGITLGICGSSLPVTLLPCVLVIYGFSASGWNGVYLAEIARKSPTNSVGIYTAVATMPLYIGLILGPIFFSLIASAFGYAFAWIALGVCGFLGAMQIPRHT